MIHLHVNPENGAAEAQSCDRTSMATRCSDRAKKDRRYPVERELFSLMSQFPEIEQFDVVLYGDMGMVLEADLFGSCLSFPKDYVYDHDYDPGVVIFGDGREIFSLRQEK
jgi:hypothetical protein